LAKGESADVLAFLGGCGGHPRLVHGRSVQTVPNVIDFVGDLVSLAFGANEKAVFLTRIKNGYPTVQSLVQPGLINLRLQMVEAKTMGETSWPLDESIVDLDQAMTDVDYVIAQTRIHIDETSVPVHSSRKFAGSPKRLQASEYEKILDSYFRVKFILINEFIELYYLRALGGDPLSQQDRIRWMEFYRQMEHALNLATPGVTLNAADFGSDTISEQDASTWRKVVRSLEPDVLLDARVGMALSSVMLAESQSHRAPEQACAVGRHYVTRAKEDESKMKRPPLNLDDADISRLHGYLLQIDTRLNASCEQR
jgi:hypothetical protein